MMEELNARLGAGKPHERNGLYPVVHSKRDVGQPKKKRIIIIALIIIYRMYY
jgi:hypothetical protein